jgi:hypothetical protein
MPQSPSLSQQRVGEVSFDHSLDVSQALEAEVLGRGALRTDESYFVRQDLRQEEVSMSVKVFEMLWQVHLRVMVS